MTMRIWFPVVAALSLASGGYSQGTVRTGSAAERHQRGVDFHLERRLDEASREYAAALAMEPSRDASPSEWALIRRLAPRLFATPSEPFALKDAAAILHPTERVIAFHLFWEDDIDFPDDNDPCDHEVVWVRFGADGQTLEGVWTYFHGRIVSGGPAAIEEARAHDQRARVNVQWGKHGSLPIGWDQIRTATGASNTPAEGRGNEGRFLFDDNRETWERLSRDGRRSKENTLARRQGWPSTFDGTFEQFTDFSRPVDLLSRLEDRKLVAVSRWNSAVIDQEFLAYNFRPKTEWPREALRAGTDGVTEPGPLLTSPGLEAFQLPAKTTFSPAMPRYPNVWFYVDVALAGSYDEAVRLVADGIRGPMRLREYQANGEGCDFEVRLEHLQPWEVREHRALQHSHAFHMRYYQTALASHHLERVTLQTSDGPREFYRLAGSAHYEVEHTNPNHADVEICPYCGRTGAYAELTGNLVEKVHDPLGLELLFDGTIRGQAIRFEDDPPRAFGGMGLLSNRYTIERHVFNAASGDRNTLRIGVVLIAPHPRG